MNSTGIESGAGPRESTLIGRLWASVVRARRRRAAVRELGRLNAHLLADIGVDREDIPTIVDAMIAGAEPREALRATRRAPVAGHGHAAGFAG